MAADKDGDGNELPWEGTTANDWRASVDSWPWRRLGFSDWGKSGTCPRCGHPMTLKTISGTGLDGGAASERLAADREHAVIVNAPIIPDPLSPDNDRHFARCDCSVAHPNRPSELKQGCGRWAYVDPPVRND